MSIVPTSDYIQRQSDNLMNIVAVVYGVALTTALTSHQEVLLHPLSAKNILPFLTLSAAGILTAFSFYIYVLSIGGGKPYDVVWTDQSKASRAIFRFATDMALAILYVRLLFTAVDVQSGPRAAPKLADFAFSFMLVFAGAVIVREVRSEAINKPGLIAAVTSLVLWLVINNITATRDIDFGVATAVILGVIVYCVLNYLFIYNRFISTARSSADAIAKVTRVTVKEGKADAYVAAFTPLLKQAKKERGTLIYAVHRSKANPRQFWTTEIYANDAALTAHNATKVHAAATKGFTELIDASDGRIDEILEVKGLRR